MLHLGRSFDCRKQDEPSTSIMIVPDILEIAPEMLVLLFGLCVSNLALRHSCKAVTMLLCH